LKNASPTELIETCQRKFMLGQARLRQERHELAILSLHGALDAGLRSHLHLYRKVPATNDWATLLQTLAEDAKQPLSQADLAYLERIHSLWETIAKGNTISLTHESIIGYQQYAAKLLQRYGILVTAPENVQVIAPQKPVKPKYNLISLWYRTQNLVLLLFGVILVAGIIIFGLRQTLQPQPETANLAQNTASQIGSSESITNSVKLIPGEVAFVGPNVGEGLALRNEPSLAVTSTVRLYLRPATAVEVIQGPITHEAQIWWQIRAANQEGWCQGQFLRKR